jgi:hypothetical protein
MHFVCRTCSSLQSGVPERESVCASCNARLLAHEPRAEHAWYTMGIAGQEGPFDAAQLASMFEGGELTWTDDVWRLGLRDWRAARKDDVLVVAVASARGLGTATSRLDALTDLLRSPGTDEALNADDTVIDVVPAGLAGSWPVRAAVQARPSRTHSVARLFKLATLAFAAFIGGALIVALVTQLARPPQLGATPLSVASASMVNTAPVTPVRPISGERVKRTLPAPDEVRAELTRLAPSVRLCVREPRLELEVSIAGDTGRPRQIEVRTPRLTPGMIECTQSALQELEVAPFMADQLTYTHHYAW